MPLIPLSRKRRPLLMAFLMAVLGCGLPVQLRAGDDLFTTHLRGSGITPLRSISIAAPVYAETGWSVYNPEITVSLRLADDRYILRTSPEAYFVRYRLTLVATDNSILTITDSLAVTYLPDDSYDDERFRKYSGYKSATLTILAQNRPMPQDITLSLTLLLPRYASSTTLNAVPDVNGTFRDTTNELMLTWGYLPGADSYDVEWLFIDNPTGDNNLPYNFANATNVNVSANYYPVPMAYPKGTLLYRVRGVGTYYQNGVKYPLYGAWSYAAQSGGALPAANHPECRYDFAGLEDSLTWQYEAAYAEDGKRKEVITFFDGTLRNRQSVTLQNTNSVAVVAETFYDHIGRPALQSIPAPTPSKGIRYYGTNADTNGLFNGNFGKMLYDADSTLCHAQPFPSDAGSVKYYSAANPFLNRPYWLNVDLTPADSGFTYTHTRYVNDGTDRTHSQSNVGATFRMGGGKDTRFFYGNPMQAELDRLFGNEVGTADHYQKVLAVDPNGETTVSYYDMKERLIASAIIPNADTSMLLPVDNTPPSISFSDHTDFDDDSREYTQNIVVGATSNYDFKYHFDPAKCLADTCGAAIGCTDCRYRIVFSLWNPETLSYVFRDSLVTSQPQDLCHGVLLAPGNYQLHKSVAVVSDDVTELAFVAYADRQRPCAEYEHAAVAPCYTVCEEYAMEQCGLSEPDTTLECYVRTLRECENPPQSPSTECEARLLAMLADMSPGGQYFDNIRSCCPSDTNCSLSVSDSNAFLNSICEQRLMADSAMVALRDLFGMSHFSDKFWIYLRHNWHSEYAEIMLPYHPEYHLYKALCDCGNADEQHVFDSIFFNVNTYQEALDMGLLNPLAMDTSYFAGISETPTYGYLPFPANYQDPFFDKTTGCCAEKYEDIRSYMSERLLSYLNWNGHHVSVWWLLFDPAQIADSGYVAGCDSIVNMMDTMQRVVVAEWAENFRCSADDARWRLFKGIYMYLKEECRQRFVLACMDDCDRTDSLLCKEGVTESNCCNCPNFAWGQQEWWADFFPAAALDYCDYYLKADTNCRDLPLTMGNFPNFQIRFLCNPVYAVNEDNIMDVADQGAEAAYDNCCAECEAYANNWMAELHDYFLTHCPSILSDPDSLVWREIRQTLIDTCIGSCGTSLANRDFSIRQRIDLQAFENLLASKCGIDSNNYVRIVYPRPSGYLTDCGCNNYQTALHRYGLTFWSAPQAIRDSLALEDIIATDRHIAEWNSYCIWQRYTDLLTHDDDTLALYSLDFPEALRCEPEMSEYELCRQQAVLEAAAQDTISFYRALDSLVAQHRARYNTHCTEGMSETLDISCTTQEFLYTLYYYDQADNLIKTVPPEGVHPLSETQVQSVAAYRNNVGRYDTLQAGFIRPAHKMATDYRYNTLNQVTETYQPDYDKPTVVFYDIMARPVLSQDARQQALKTYTYTLYDAIGRIVETGQVKNTSTISREDARDAAKLHNFITTGTRTEVTRTFYDKGLLAGLQQTNLRNRVAAQTQSNNYNSDISIYNSATHYSYDFHGNVDRLVQDLPALVNFNRRFLTIDYEYDLVSGNVTGVWYQKGYAEQFRHRYRYNADNALTHVFTAGTYANNPSGFSLQERLDARYFYLPNGLLSRVELGSQQIQRIDYAYTLQGWLKSINGSPASDSVFAADVFATRLQFFQGDYLPVAGTWQPFPSTLYRSLYNGNIAALSSQFADHPFLLKSFRYDKLNRIKRMRTADSSDLAANALTQKFATDYTYDFNGNILSLQRKKQDMSLLHKIEYTYSGNNRLQKIAATGINSSAYKYDPIGNLTWDDGERMGVSWNAIGKVKDIKKLDTAISFTYSPTGQRLSKCVTPISTTIQPATTDYYVRDAAGEVMCVYEQNRDTLSVSALSIYGSTRLGEYKRRVQLGLRGATLRLDSSRLGQRQYQLTDHLGNVIATFANRKLLGADSLYHPVIISTTDYYPYGYPMPGRTFADSSYRYGFSGQESDNEVYGVKACYTAEFWQYDARLGRRWNVDPVLKAYASPYACFAGNPIVFADRNGDTIRNGYTSSVNILRASIELCKKLMDGCEDKESKQYANWATNLARNTAKLEQQLALSATIDMYISLFKKKNPSLFEEIDSKKTDVYLLVNYDIATPAAAQLKWDGDALTSDFGKNTTSILINPTVDENGNTFITNAVNWGKVLSHEFGHLAYAIPHSKEYKAWLISNDYYGVPSYDGHATGDLSGDRANEETRKFNAGTEKR